MTYTFDGINYWLRLDDGDSLKDSLKKFMTETKLESAWVSGIGATKGFEIGCYNLDDKAHRWQQFDGLREVLSLQGNIVKNEAGDYMHHLHGSFGDERYQVIGGHVKELTAAVTLELYIHRSHYPLQRKTNQEFNMQLLSL